MVLGPVEAFRAGRPVDLGRPQQRALLGLLAVRLGTVVSVETLIDALWPDDPPASAEKVVQTHVSRLRKVLGEAAIARRGRGYVLQLPAGSLDLLRFEMLSADGRFAEALALWRGPALADVAGMPGLRAEAERLEESRLGVVEERIDRDIATRRPAGVVSELQTLVRSYPLRERLWALLMRALYSAGRQAEALAAYKDARRVLVDELGIEPGAELKELQRRILAQDATLLPAVTKRSRRLAVPDLPLPPTPFLGRRRELEDLAALLTDEETRLLTLTGPGGIGKSRLALRAGTLAADHFADGVIWVGLGALRDSALVPLTIAQRAGVREVRGESVTEALSSALGGTRSLLLLDDAEHLLPAIAEEIAALCAGGVRLLVTSRERLRLQGEHVYAVPPLRREDALSLFVTRAAAVGSTVDLSAETAELCRRLDDLPLALELAAARTVILSPGELLRRLDRRLDLFKGTRDSDPRQKTLRATMEWSYELLEEEERQLFRRLSVFAGGFMLEAVEVICDAAPDVLQQLVEKSLVRHAGERFSVLETIREYAAERLAESGELAQARLTHAEYFASFAEQAALDEPTREDQAAWLSRLAAEHENFRTALDFADSQELAELELRLVKALRTFWFLRGFWAEGRGYLERALRRAEAKPAAVRIDLLSECAQLAERQGDHERARALDSEHLRLARELGDERKLANALMRAGIGAEVRGDFDRARAHLSEALAISAGRGDDWFSARVHLNLGYSYVAENDLDDAEDQLEQALEQARTLGNRGLLCACLYAVALVKLMRGLGEAALPQTKEALLLAIEIRSPEHISEVLALLAGELAACGADEEAAHLLGAAKTLREELALVQVDVIRRQDDSTAELLRERLGEERFEAASAEGAEMGIERGIEVALQAVN